MVWMFQGSSYPTTATQSYTKYYYEKGDTDFDLASGWRTISGDYTNTNVTTYFILQGEHNYTFQIPDCVKYHGYSKQQSPQS